MRPFLGAYALVAGLALEQATATYRGLAGLPIAGLELPIAAAAAGPEWWAAHVRPEWDVVLTAIPTVMGCLAEDPGYGLAATDPDGRAAALADLRSTAALARRLADESGRARVRAIQVHSAPRPPRSSPEALVRSLDQVAALDLAGALVTIEHCDAPRPGQPVQKGFLQLEQEIDLLRGRAERLTLNWGRSAIEGRSARTPVDQVAAADAARVLGGLMFSGASAVDTDWGPAWDDHHPAPRGSDPALARSAHSLLGAAEIAAALAACTAPPAYLGLKVTVHPAVTDPADRVAVARAGLDLLAAG